MPLIPGRYRIDIVLRGRQEIQDGLQAAIFFDVEPGVIDGRPMPVAASDGDIVLRHVPDFDSSTMEMRASREGKYLSLTCVVNATSREQLDELYRELSGHPQVVMVL